MNYFINLFKQSLKPYGSINRLDFWIIILINYGLLPVIFFFFSKLNKENSNSYTAIDLLPSSDFNASPKDAMKDELKSFLKKQLNNSD